MILKIPGYSDTLTRSPNGACGGGQDGRNEDIPKVEVGDGESSGSGDGTKEDRDGAEELHDCRLKSR